MTSFNYFLINILIVKITIPRPSDNKSEFRNHLDSIFGMTYFSRGEVKVRSILMLQYITLITVLTNTKGL
jgi:hypothetical protein